MAGTWARNAGERTDIGMAKSKKSKDIVVAPSKELGSDKIKWHVRGDKTVKISIAKNDLVSGGWDIVTAALSMAMSQLEVDVNATLRMNEDDTLEIIVEK